MNRLMLLLLLVTANAWAVRGVIYTTDGASYEGEIRFAEGAFLVSGVTVSPQRVVRARFQKPPPPAPASLPRPAPQISLDPAPAVPNVDAAPPRVLLATGEAAPQTWRYTTNKPPEDWLKAGFDDSTWALGPAGFGDPSTPHSIVRTPWKTRDIWLRKSFRLDVLPARLRVRIFHDEDVALVLNGNGVLKLKSNSDGYIERELGGAACELLRVGDNLLAIHCKNIVGGQNIDVGLIGEGMAAPVPAPAHSIPAVTNPPAAASTVKPEEAASKSDPPGRPRLPAGVMLVGGSVLARTIQSADETWVRFADTNAEPSLAMARVAGLFPQPVLPELVAKIPAARPGLLLTNQEFIEAEFRSLSGDKLLAHSASLGDRTYDASQVAVVVLRDVKPIFAVFEVQTHDGSRFPAGGLRIERDGLALEDAEVPGLRIRTSAVAEIRRVE